jgi:ADP-heptose:LPS heptosyltransferase
MDLVITVDTALAHLAGALGIPTLLMVTHEPDWRWMLNRDDSPWYPTLRLYRQLRPGDWDSVVHRILTDLVGEQKDPS